MSIAEPKWYIATTIIGTEDVVYKNIEDKIRAYGLTDFVKEIKLLKSRECIVEIFDNKNNPPPKTMKNTKFITWETLPGNRYKKTRIREVNTFPGYIYIQMIMTQEVWYAIRNTHGITGFVGSSGKGAQPIPMSESEVKILFDENKSKEILISNEEEMNKDYLNEIEQQNTPAKSSSKVEFLTAPEILSVSNKPFVIDNNDFFDSQKNNDIKDVLEETIKKPNESVKELFLNDNTDDIKANDFNESLNDFKIGMFVKIVSGGMKDTVGTIMKIDEINKKIHVEIEILGSKREIILNPDDLSFDIE